MNFSFRPARRRTSESRPLPPVDELRRLFQYDAETGVLTRRARDDTTPQARARFSGKPAGAINQLGYIQVQIRKEIFLAHRIVWKMFYGAEPPLVLDHINRNPSDNRIINLRAATRSQNAANMEKWSKNGLPKGVRLTKEGRFQSVIKANGKQMCLGTFATMDEAADAYITTAKALHGAFANV